MENERIAELAKKQATDLHAMYYNGIDGLRKSDSDSPVIDVYVALDSLGFEEAPIYDLLLVMSHRGIVFVKEPDARNYG